MVSVGEEKNKTVEGKWRGNIEVRGRADSSGNLARLLYMQDARPEISNHALEHAILPGSNRPKRWGSEPLFFVTRLQGSEWGPVHLLGMYLAVFTGALVPGSHVASAWYFIGNEGQDQGSQAFLMWHMD